ncbi:MAG: mechanosensitive ion channel family protein [Actinomycetospora sp.]|nr:mechanosensitive ion channel family protein [Actinomycetospora sp.]
MPFSPVPALDALVHTGLQVALIVVVAVVVRAVVVRIIGHVGAGAGVPGLVTLLRRRRGVTDADRIRAFGSARRAQRARTVGSVIGNAATILIFGTAFTMALGQVGVNLAPVLASAYVLGLAVGFGAQNLVRDFLSGIFMLLEDQYGVGDHVDLGDAVGTIERVGLRTTTVRDVAGMVWYVRNGTIERVGNGSQDHAVAVVDVPLAIDTDITHAAAIAETAAAAGIEEAGHGADVLGAPQVLGVESLSASGMTLRLTVRTEPGRQWAVQRTVTERVVSALRADDVALAAVAV